MKVFVCTAKFPVSTVDAVSPEILNLRGHFRGYLRVHTRVHFCEHFRERVRGSNFAVRVLCAFLRF